MAITSSEIHNQSFSIDRKGYDVDEVDVFLEYVADEIDNLNNTISGLNMQLAERTELDNNLVSESLEASVVDEPAVEPAVVVAVDEDMAAALADAQAQIVELERQLEVRKLEGSAISKALIVAQRSADDIVARAQDEAAQIIRDAEEDANQIVDAAEAEREKIYDSIRALEDERDDTRDEYHEILAGFITDASQKLANLDAAMAASVKSAHGRVPAAAQTAVIADAAAFAEASEVATNQVPIRQESVGVAAYTTPQFDDVVAAPVTPMASLIEKDLSGFGDVEDAFEFDIN